MEQHFEKEIHGGQFGEIHNHYAKKDEPIPHSHLTVTCPQCGAKATASMNTATTANAPLGLSSILTIKNGKKKSNVAKPYYKSKAKD